MSQHDIGKGGRWGWAGSCVHLPQLPTGTTSYISLLCIKQLTTAFLKAEKKRKESLKFRRCLLLLSVALVRAHLSEAVLCRLSRHMAGHPWLFCCPTITFTVDERRSHSSSLSPHFLLSKSMLAY